MTATHTLILRQTRIGAALNSEDTMEMKFTTFLLLVLLFPYWFTFVAAFFIGVGLLWMIGYPMACTVHLLYVRMRYGKWVDWHLLYPRPDRY